MRTALLLAVLCVVLVQTETNWCVPGCVCTVQGESRIADCARLKLLNVDSEFLGGILYVQALDLSDNSLTTLADDFPDNVKGRWRLVALSLAKNAISWISPNALRGLTALQSLDLSFNRLSSVPAGVFKPATNLRALDLSGNKLRAQTGGWLLDAPHVTHLSLSHCSIVHLSQASFSWLPALQTLDLSDNQLDTLDARLVLGALSALTRLELVDNPLRCDANLAAWLAERHIEQGVPVCRNTDGPQRSEAIRMEHQVPAVFAGLACHQVLNEDEREKLDDTWRDGNVSHDTSTRSIIVIPFKGWHNLWGIPAGYALLMGLVGGVLLSVSSVWCWRRLTECCCCCRHHDVRRSSSGAALLMGESSTSLLFEETPTLHVASTQPPGTPPPPYMR